MLFSVLTACSLFDGDRYADTGDPYGIRGGETDADTDADGDADVDATEDGHLVYDTSIAMFQYAGDGKVNDDGSFESGHFGNIWLGVQSGRSVCDVMGEWSVAGPADSGCTGCAWSFKLTVDDTTAEGSECDDLAPMGAVDGYWDGSTYSFGWMDVLEYRYGGSSFYLYDTVLIFVSGGWYPLAYNFYGYDQVEGDSQDFSFVRPVVYSYAAYYTDL